MKLEPKVWSGKGRKGSISITKYSGRLFCWTVGLYRSRVKQGYESTFEKAKETAEKVLKGLT